MRPRLAAVYVLLVLLPLGILGWLGLKLAQEEHVNKQNDLQQLMQQGLTRLDDTIARVIENLENELFKGLKGKIKDDYLPRKNSSIVFKFSVTSKGKIKDLDIQSRVNIELEEIIKTTVNSLKNWTRGNKNIPVIYTVYVTFQ